MSESNKIEKELNFKVTDYEGLEAYLQEHCQYLGDQKIGFDYFHNEQDTSMYARIERHITAEGEQLYLTAKRKLAAESAVQQRKEITIHVSNKENIITLLEVLGLTYIDSKGKIRERFHFEGLDIDLDSWYNEKFEGYVESRIEIEGDNEEKIMEFAKRIEEFIEK